MTSPRISLGIYNRNNDMIDIIHINNCAIRIIDKINNVKNKIAYSILLQEFNIILHKHITDYNNTIEDDNDINTQIYNDDCIKEYIKLLNFTLSFPDLIIKNINVN